MNGYKQALHETDGWMDGYIKINTARYGWMNQWMHGWMGVSKHCMKWMDVLVGWLING